MKRPSIDTDPGSFFLLEDSEILCQLIIQILAP